MSAENKAVVRRYTEEVLNNRNLAMADELFAGGYVLHDPSLPGAKGGPEGAKQLVGMILNAFPDIHYTLEDIVAEGDKVAYRWSARGTHKGEFMGVAATGKQATGTGTTIVRIINGKFQESWQNWDASGLMQQLGVVPSLQ
jgi:steroid delta-isomerase-like uncharacterized protein